MRRFVREVDSSASGGNSAPSHGGGGSAPADDDDDEVVMIEEEVGIKCPYTQHIYLFIYLQNLYSALFTI